MKIFTNEVLFKMQILVEQELNKKYLSKEVKEIAKNDLHLINKAINTDHDISEKELFNLLMLNNEHLNNNESYLSCAECDSINDNLINCKYSDVHYCDDCQTVEGDSNEIFIAYPDGKTMFFIDYKNYRVYNSNDELLIELY